MGEATDPECAAKGTYFQVLREALSIYEWTSLVQNCSKLEHMKNDIRQAYLKGWPKYPNLKKSALSPKELRKKLAKVVMGEKPKEMQIQIAGRLRVQGEVTSHEMAKSGITETFPIFYIESDGENVGVALKIQNGSIATLTENPSHFEAQDVLQDGDLILVNT
ncbi:MAG: hypothetical protein KDD25_08550, partial [Bdellovibrionales bacterium]|nr:hypothetical protein [Bdellovibrionales bacterium]